MDAFAGYGSDDSSETGGKDAGDDHDEASAPAAPVFKPAWQVEEQEDEDDSDDEEAAQKTKPDAKTDDEAKRKGHDCERLQCGRGGGGDGGNSGAREQWPAGGGLVVSGSRNSSAREQRPACERKPRPPPRGRSFRAH